MSVQGFITAVGLLVSLGVAFRSGCHATRAMQQRDVLVAARHPDFPFPSWVVESAQRTYRVNIRSAYVLGAIAVVNTAVQLWAWNVGG